MENKLSYIKERILHLVNNKGFVKDKFFTDIGMTYGSFKGESKKRPINSDALANILSIVPDVNADWLLTGSGDMLKKDDPIVIFNGKKQETQSIPLYDMDAAASILNLFEDRGAKVINHLQIPNIPNSDGAMFITGDSMYPILKSGDIVIYKGLDLSVESFIWGQMYLLAADIGGFITTLIKWVQKSSISNEYICLVSQNEHHQPLDIHISKIKAVARVNASIRYY